MIVRRGYSVRLGRINRIAFLADGVTLPAVLTVLAASRGRWTLAAMAFVLALMGFCQYYAMRHFTLVMDRRIIGRRQDG